MSSLLRVLAGTEVVHLTSGASYRTLCGRPWKYVEYESWDDAPPDVRAMASRRRICQQCRKGGGQVDG